MPKKPDPDALSEEAQAKADADALRELIARNQSRPLPRPAPADGASDDELLRRLIRVNRVAEGKAAEPVYKPHPAKAPAHSAYGRAEHTVFGTDAALKRADANNLLLAAQVIALANRLVTRIWHSGSDHAETGHCQRPQCQFKTAAATPAWRDETVQVVLEWRRVATFSHSRPSQRLLGPSVCRQVEMLQSGVPLTEYAGNLPRLWENLSRIAQAAGLHTGHLAGHARRHVLSVAQATAIAAHLTAPLTVPMVKVIRLLTVQEGMSLDIASIVSLTGGQADEALLWRMNEQGWADASFRHRAWRFTASARVAMLPAGLWRGFTDEQVVAAVSARMGRR